MTQMHLRVLLKDNLGELIFEKRPSNICKEFMDGVSYNTSRHILSDFFETFKL